ncbi:MAG: L-glutamate gamma-semialdehyde dehydrogenase [Bdellovibrionales bacterium]|nr:L-glutamate gamma-semialdehyde dehydrogenase [Bdellovibrionales bacterium]
MSNLQSTVPVPKNEPVLNYRPGSPETKALKKQLADFEGSPIEIPIVINGEELRTGKTAALRAPHNKSLELGTFHQAGTKEVQAAIEGSQKALQEWSRFSADARASIFLKAGELLAGKYRPILNAATMLGQSKTAHQAEIDSACELIDFFRFNVAFQKQLYSIQPESAPGMWNRLQYRPLEGFVFAVTPFNFTSIGGNLPTAPALMGNVVLWKPASTSVYSAYFTLKLLEEAGLPPGVIQFLPGRGAEVGNPVLESDKLAGIHFTGSTDVFQHMWQTVGSNIQRYKSYPRIVGETGGKDFVFAHASADRKALVTALVRGAFEYQGQKCSAASRAYIPKSVWTAIKEELTAEVESIRLGDISDFRNFMGAVIDAASFEKLRGFIEGARKDPNAEIVVGGNCDDKQGYFVSPTIIEAKKPDYITMQEELFGPVLTVYVYDDSKFEQTLSLCDKTSPYGLTGCIFAQDRAAVDRASSVLEHSAGNFYINNKPTGAVVGQQPFGGSRASGTNDKAGSLFNLVRWVSMRTVSETFAPPTDYRYPYMEAE